MVHLAGRRLRMNEFFVGFIALLFVLAFAGLALAFGYFMAWLLFGRKK
jgi:hypothetical protein